MLHDVVQRKKFYTLVLQKCLTRSEFGRKEFEHRLGLLVGLEEHQYGNGWELLVHDAIEYEHYERLTQISLEEFLNEAQ